MPRVALSELLKVLDEAGDKIRRRCGGQFLPDDDDVLAHALVMSVIIEGLGYRRRLRTVGHVLHEIAGRSREQPAVTAARAPVRLALVERLLEVVIEFAGRASELDVLIALAEVLRFFGRPELEAMDEQEGDPTCGTA